jgi:hypothetical protein
VFTLLFCCHHLLKHEKRPTAGCDRDSVRSFALQGALMISSIAESQSHAHHNIINFYLSNRTFVLQCPQKPKTANSGRIMPDSKRKKRKTASQGDKSMVRPLSAREILLIRRWLRWWPVVVVVVVVALILSIVAVVLHENFHRRRERQAGQGLHDTRR